MITSFRHKGLEGFFRSGTHAGIQPIHAKRLREMLAALHAAAAPDDLARPSWRLHGLSGKLAGFHAMTVQANWRLVFRFDGTDVELLDYIDYH
ncbi:MAG: Plasmid maintenance system killer protein [Candidatus Accumulibacter appositus]|jgi:proteic killer suppression protein|uniref:Plasmid maintenance system killer protein n=1 Tax=Candidatus Accumulibacter appositus TaxID=1454003 RepID=A0A011N3N4_9PROT|nr:MAG: Plasmid maintenance system killer protein [Candidatus Accumulibacter appositus]